jgi:hypothetical protein
MHVGGGCMLYATKSVAKRQAQRCNGMDKSVSHGTKMYFAIWMGQFCPSHHGLGQIKFEHAPPHYAQANLQTAGAE